MRRPLASPEQRGREVRVEADGVHLVGDLEVPEGAKAMVVFVHGSGSGRHSPRNRAVARRFREAGLGTFLLDLLTEDEEEQDRSTRHLRFDIPFLARRVQASVQWTRQDPDTADLRVGLFGSSTGGGAALVAAAQAPQSVHAVVSRGGRPDLAAGALPEVRAPTLLVVGGRDGDVLRLNKDAKEQMRTDVRLEVVEGATHLFEEPGALEKVADLSADWFCRHLG